MSEDKEFLEVETDYDRVVMDKRKRCMEEMESLKANCEKMYYKFCCVIDNATGGRASKPEIELEIIYSLINENINKSMQMAADEAISELEALQAPKSCDGCMYANDELDECQIIDYTDEHCIRWSNKDFYEPKEQNAKRNHKTSYP